ncbi:Lipase 5 [Didymosphaeria variabile]|uniref:Lipase 5 n=1 Tax=Didymosphaeria variabile TaxID=1932322 RepID=A0A9W8XTM0_9PLEO|nr:Lipase 5 [Didymosphaeria variabile]KAJ4358451.1 Lipase 5 [Didymosphaeria variabile]
MAKDRKTGREVPWDPTPNEGWIDGSVDNDLPMTRLAEMFNVNHFIVSQVNPHVVPFLAKEENDIGAEVQQQDSAFSAGSGWMHNMASFAKGEALHRLEVLAEMGVFPNTMSKVRSVLNQTYSGDITIFPAISYTNFPKILSNPTTDYMLRCLLTGEQATWLKVSRIQNHVAVELALDDAVNKILPCVHFSKSQAELRLLSFNRPASQGTELPSAHPLRRHKRDVHSEGQGLPLAPFTPVTEIPSPDLHRRPESRGKGLDSTASKPYLPSRPSMRTARSPDFNRVAFSTVEAVSSTDADDSPTDADVSDNNESDTTEILSSPSLSHSPPPSIHDLWLSASQAHAPYPSVSHPHTPAAPADLFNSQYGNPDLTPAAPSSPELRYKRLFHPPAKTGDAESAYKQEVKRTLQPLSNIPSLKHTESNPEHLKAPTASLKKAGSLDEDKVAADDVPVFSPVNSRENTASSPLSTRNGAKEKEESYFQRKMRESRRGNGTPRWGSPTDSSGTRGIVWRKKKKRSGSMSGERPA